MPLNTYEPETLYATSSKGDIKVWKGSVKDVGDKSIIEYEFGLEKVPQMRAFFRGTRSGNGRDQMDRQCRRPSIRVELSTPSHRRGLCM